MVGSLGIGGSRWATSAVGRAGIHWTSEPLAASLQLPLPLKELMENEALEILTKALKSEPSSHKRPRGISQGLGPWDWGFRMCLSCQILLPPTNIPGVPQKNEKFGTRCKETQSGDHGVTARRPGSSLSAAPL